MGLEKNDIQDVKLARPVAVVDLWEMDDRISRLEEVTERLEKIVHTLLNLYHQERVKDWELILKQMMKDTDRNGYKT